MLKCTIEVTPLILFARPSHLQEKGVKHCYLRLNTGGGLGLILAEDIISVVYMDLKYQSLIMILIRIVIFIYSTSIVLLRLQYYYSITLVLLLL